MVKKVWQLSSILLNQLFHLFALGVFVLDPLRVLLFAFGVLQAWKSFSQETSLSLVETCRMVGGPGRESHHWGREEIGEGRWVAGRGCTKNFIAGVKRVRNRR